MATRKEDDEDEEPRVETYQWLSDGAIREMFWDIDRLDANTVNAFIVTYDERGGRL